MTAMKQRAIELIKKMPDDKIYYLVNLLEGMDGSVFEITSISESQTAYQRLQKFRRQRTDDYDCKAELRSGWEQKYAHLG